MAKTLVRHFSEPGDTVLDPFVGSGTVALESLIEGRRVICCDTNPYAVALTKAKLFAPPAVDQAFSSARYFLELSKNAKNDDPSNVPEWVTKFYHPNTLREIVALASLLRERRQHFLMGCLLGILHHQRPGFLSFPASHAVPYLRTKRFPKDRYPELYEHREVGPRLLKKIARVYRRVPPINYSLTRKCVRKDVKDLNLPKDSIDAVVTSPPYMNALDYIRDNRLRLWFLGHESQVDLSKNSPSNPLEFRELISEFFAKIDGILRPEKKVVIVTGEVNRGGHVFNTAATILKAAEEIGSFTHIATMEDNIPKDRRIRRTGQCTRKEWILVLRKRP